MSDDRNQVNDNSGRIDDLEVEIRRLQAKVDELEEAKP